MKQIPRQTTKTDSRKNNLNNSLTSEDYLNSPITSEEITKQKITTKKLHTKESPN